MILSKMIHVQLILLFVILPPRKTVLADSFQEFGRILVPRTKPKLLRCGKLKRIRAHILSQNQNILPNQTESMSSSDDTFIVQETRYPSMVPSLDFYEMSMSYSTEFTLDLLSYSYPIQKEKIIFPSFQPSKVSTLYPSVSLLSGSPSTFPIKTYAPSPLPSSTQTLSPISPPSFLPSHISTISPSIGLSSFPSKVPSNIQATQSLTPSSLASSSSTLSPLASLSAPSFPSISPTIEISTAPTIFISTNNSQFTMDIISGPFAQTCFNISISTLQEWQNKDILQEFSLLFVFQMEVLVSEVTTIISNFLSYVMDNSELLLNCKNMHLIESYGNKTQHRLLKEEFVDSIVGFQASISNITSEDLCTTSDNGSCYVSSSEITFYTLSDDTEYLENQTIQLMQSMLDADVVEEFEYIVKNDQFFINISKDLNISNLSQFEDEKENILGSHVNISLSLEGNQIVNANPNEPNRFKALFSSSYFWLVGVFSIVAGVVVVLGLGFIVYGRKRKGLLFFPGLNNTSYSGQTMISPDHLDGMFREDYDPYSMEEDDDLIYSSTTLDDNLNAFPTRDFPFCTDDDMDWSMDSITIEDDEMDDVVRVRRRGQRYYRFEV